MEKAWESKTPRWMISSPAASAHHSLRFADASCRGIGLLRLTKHPSRSSSCNKTSIGFYLWKLFVRCVENTEQRLRWWLSCFYVPSLRQINHDLRVQTSCLSTQNKFTENDLHQLLTWINALITVYWFNLSFYVFIFSGGEPFKFTFGSQIILLINLML